MSEKKNKPVYDNIEKLYALYRQFGGNVLQLDRHIKESGLKDLPQSRRSLYKYIKEYDFEGRVKEEQKKIKKEMDKKYLLEKEKIITIAMNGMIQYAKRIQQGGGPKTAQEFRALWEIYKIELGEPTQITENTNKNLDVLAFINSVTNGETTEGEPTEGVGLLAKPKPEPNA